MAQDYAPFVEKGKAWIMFYSDEYPEKEYFGYQIGGDTIVENVACNILYFLDLEVFANQQFDVHSKSICGFLREDVDAKKVYLMNPVSFHHTFQLDACSLNVINQNLKEYLVLDFDKTVGDHFDDCMVDDFDVASLITEENIESLYGGPRRILINEWGTSLTEGIGYDDGFLVEAHSWVHAGWGFGLVRFCNNLDQNICSELTSVKNIEDNLSSEINVRNDLTSLEVSAPFKIDKLTLYSTNGELIKHANDDKVETHNLSHGIYILMIKTNNKYYSKRVFL